MDNYRKTLDELYTNYGFDNTIQVGRQKLSVCYYCGSLASGIDHVPPLSQIRRFKEKGEQIELDKDKYFRVPCCDYCNLTLRAKPLMTPEARKEYIEQNTNGIIPEFNYKRGRPKAPKERYGYYVSLSIMDIARAILTCRRTGKNDAIQNVSKLLRMIVEEWVEYNNTKGVESIEEARAILTRYGIPIGNQKKE